MKRWLVIWVLVWCCASAYGAGKPSRNQPLPSRPDTLRILAVGNSFSDDGMMYLPDLLREANVGPVVLARLFFAGCSLERHCRFYEDDAHRYTYSKSDGGVWRTAGPVPSATPVTDANAPECQRAAILAVERPFQTTLFP